MIFFNNIFKFKFDLTSNPPPFSPLAGASPKKGQNNLNFYTVNGALKAVSLKFSDTAGTWTVKDFLKDQEYDFTKTDIKDGGLLTKAFNGPGWFRAFDSDDEALASIERVRAYITTLDTPLRLNQVEDTMNVTAAAADMEDSEVGLDQEDSE